MSCLAHKEEYKGCKIEIFTDDDAQNPRKEWENLCTMVCWHNSYNLGDEQPKVSPVDHMRDLVRAEDEGYLETLIDDDDTDEVIRKMVKEAFDRLFFSKPLYLYDHSGITISTGPFSCQWDSGQVGFIYLSRVKAKKEYDGFLKNQTLEDVVNRAMDAEVETYDQYLTGDVYGYVISGDNVDPLNDSCWGYFGLDYCIQEARSAVDYQVTRLANNAAAALIDSLTMHPRSVNLWR